jgi:glycine oxidase
MGGGVIGLATAWRLAQRGLRTVVVERDRVMGAASRASAAMVAPVGYVEDAGDAFLRLRVDSAARWPSFAAELFETTGVDPYFRTTGSLVAAMTAAELATLRRLRTFHSGLGIRSDLLDPAAARTVEPGLGDAVLGALHVPGEGCVDPRRLATALVAAIGGLGGEIREGRPAAAVRLARGRVAGLDDLPADAVVLAAGAWSATVPGVPDEACPRLRPVKGQSVLVHGVHLGTVVRAGVNLVPRPDGHVMLAGTVEPGAGFDTRPTVGGLSTVLTGASRALPAIAGATVVAHAVGLRPVGVDDARALGPSTVDGLWWATGHSYYGILLAPVTADLLAGALTGDPAATARVALFHPTRTPSYIAL